MRSTTDSNRLIILSVIGGVIFTVIGLALSGTLAVRAGHSEAMASHHVSDSEVQGSKDYWDPNHMDHAKPVGPQITPGGRPTPGGGSQAPGNPDPDYSTPDSVAATNVPAPYTAKGDTAIRGKIFFEVPQGEGECTGTVVHSKSGDMVWTAAHCLHGGKDGTFYTHVTFVPGYNGNATSQSQRAPFGIWAARRVEVDSNWVRNADPERDSIASPFDFGAFQVDPQNGKTLEQTVGGGADIYFNAPRHLQVDSYGYPGEAPYDGTTMYTCSSPTTDFSNTGWPQPDMLWMGCDMTAGSSGGGWFATIDGKRYLVSNVSLGVTVYGGHTMTGPYLGSAAQSLYNRFG